MSPFNKDHGSFLTIEEYTDILSDFHDPRGHNLAQKRLVQKEEYEKTLRKFKEIGDLAEAGRLEQLQKVFEDSRKEGEPIDLAHPMFGTVVRLPLVAAIGMRRVPCMQFLLDQGANPAKKNTHDRRNAFEEALFTEQEEWANKFAPPTFAAQVAEKNKNQATQSQTTPPPQQVPDQKEKKHGYELTFAEYQQIQRDYYDPYSSSYESIKTKTLLQEYEERTELMSALERAATWDDPKYLKKIFEEQEQKGQPINLNDFSFSRCSRVPLASALASGSKECVKFLLEKGANPNQLDGYGRPAWHAGVESQRYNMVKDLLDKHGADINIANSNTGNTALHIAASRLQLDTVSFLAANGANQKLENKEGRVPKQLGDMSTVALYRALRATVAPPDPHEPRADHSTSMRPSPMNK